MRASDPRVSAWVSANAGAGKTHTLANRVTRLLLAGAKPERILCLTYTKAAAAEMAERLFNQLGEWSMLGDTALAEKITLAGADPGEKENLRAAPRSSTTRRAHRPATRRSKSIWHRNCRSKAPCWRAAGSRTSARWHRPN